MAVTIGVIARSPTPADGLAARWRWNSKGVVHVTMCIALLIGALVAGDRG